MRATLFALAALLGIALGVSALAPHSGGQQLAWTEQGSDVPVGNG